MNTVPCAQIKRLMSDEYCLVCLSTVEFFLSQNCNSYIVSLFTLSNPLDDQLLDMGPIQRISWQKALVRFVVQPGRFFFVSRILIAAACRLPGSLQTMTRVQTHDCPSGPGSWLQNRGKFPCFSRILHLLYLLHLLHTHILLCTILGQLSFGAINLWTLRLNLSF